jgi:hypothetical protein
VSWREGFTKVDRCRQRLRLRPALYAWAVARAFWDLEQNSTERRKRRQAHSAGLGQLLIRSGVVFWSGGVCRGTEAYVGAWQRLQKKEKRQTLITASRCRSDYEWLHAWGGISDLEYSSFKYEPSKPMHESLAAVGMEGRSRCQTFLHCAWLSASQVEQRFSRRRSQRLSPGGEPVLPLETHNNSRGVRYSGQRMTMLRSLVVAARGRLIGR